MRTIYLDYNATTPIAPRAQQMMLPFLAECYGNPSSVHSLGRASSEALEDARMKVGLLLGVDAETIAFTSGGTESSNMAILGAMYSAPAERRHLIISNIEHPATVEPARHLESQGWDLTIVPVEANGIISPAAIRAALRDETRLVSIMHANNEIGTIQPIREIAQACHERDVLVHTDAAQSAGKIPTMARELDVDLMTLAGHKVYAPKGIGALYIRPGVSISRVLFGAGQERGRRAGTENVAFATALGESALLASESLTVASERLSLLRDRLAEQLRSGVGDGISFNGEDAPRLPNTLSVNFPGVFGAEVLRRAPEICASTGAACHSGHVGISDTLAAIGLTEDVARGTIRLSVGWYTTEDEIDRAANSLISAWEAARDE